MQVEMALRAKRGRIVTIRMTETCLVAARLLWSENIGALVVKDSCGTEGDVILGVLSERDILQSIVDHGTAAFAMPVVALMTQDVISCQSDDSVDRALAMMDEHHIRHLPVRHGEFLVGGDQHLGHVVPRGGRQIGAERGVSGIGLAKCRQ